VHDAVFASNVENDARTAARAGVAARTIDTEDVEGSDGKFAGGGVTSSSNTPSSSSLLRIASGHAQRDNNES
jgi:hypothetical protein